MIRIYFDNGDYEEWKSEEFTDYKYDGKYFIVINKQFYVGFYNLEFVRWIKIEDHS